MHNDQEAELVKKRQEKDGSRSAGSELVRREKEKEVEEE